MIFTKQQQHRIVTCIYPKAVRRRRVPALPFSLQSAALTSGFPNGFFQQPGPEMSQTTCGPFLQMMGFLCVWIYQGSISKYITFQAVGIPWDIPLWDKPFWKKTYILRFLLLSFAASFQVEDSSCKRPMCPSMSWNLEYSSTGAKCFTRKLTTNKGLQRPALKLIQLLTNLRHVKNRENEHEIISNPPMFPIKVRALAPAPQAKIFYKELL